MNVIDATRRSGVGVSPDRTVEQVAQLMDQANVGAVVVIDGDELVGIVTDRDLVRRAVARGLTPHARIDGVMSSPVVTIDGEADLHDAFALFSKHAVRRLGIVSDGSFAGVIAVDDLLIDLASDLVAIARPVAAEVLFGHHDSPVPAVP